MSRRNASKDDDAATRSAYRISREVLNDENPTDKFLVVTAAIIREEMKEQESKPKNRNGW